MNKHGGEIGRPTKNSKSGETVHNKKEVQISANIKEHALGSIDGDVEETSDETTANMSEVDQERSEHRLSAAGTQDQDEHQDFQDDFENLHQEIVNDAKITILRVFEELENDAREEDAQNDATARALHEELTYELERQQHLENEKREKLALLQSLLQSWQEEAAAMEKDD